MAFVTPETAAKEYEVVIVGSGASGAQVAYALTMEGVKVLMLEAGRDYDYKESPMFRTDSEAPLHGVSTPDKPLGFYDATVDGGWALPGEPFSQGKEAGNEEWVWWRTRMLGGRTNHWGRQAQRMGSIDFKPYSWDGLGFDWPITYEDLAPWYDKAEMLIGVAGENEGGENLPNSDYLMPAPKPRIGDLLVKQRARRLGLPVSAIHNAILPHRQDHVKIPKRLHPNNPRAQRILAESMQGRSQCLFSTNCTRGCAVRATYQSTTVQLPPAIATGNLDIVTHAMAREILMGPNGRAAGVIYLDKRTGQEHRVKSRAVVLGGGSMESVRLLFNTRTASFPQGIGNSSGLLGKYIVDSISAALSGHVPMLENLPLHNEDGFAGMHHTYIPWWAYADQKAGKFNFPRGYEILYTTGRQMPGPDFSGYEGFSKGTFGREFKANNRRYYGSVFTLKGEGAMIPNEHTYCELDPALKDKWGIPVLRFHCRRTDHEYNQAIHQQKTFIALFEAMGGKVLSKPDFTGRKITMPGGHLKHEVGGARMGTSPKNSVTNKWSQLWDVPNVFLADGSVFCGNGDKGPTLTIIALAWRTADHLLDLVRRGELS